MAELRRRTRRTSHFTAVSAVPLHHRQIDHSCLLTLMVHTRDSLAKAHTSIHGDTREGKRESVPPYYPAKHRDQGAGRREPTAPQKPHPRATGTLGSGSRAPPPASPSGLILKMHYEHVHVHVYVHVHVAIVSGFHGKNELLPTHDLDVLYHSHVIFIDV